uniref:VAH1 n=1 Tax=Vibrio anguillarum TaxID=55601 RepID=O07850_VIBAN|nr:VAH1 [Vibrio anguillarum]
MSINRRKALGAIAIMSGLVWNTAQADVNQPQGLAIEMSVSFRMTAKSITSMRAIGYKERLRPRALMQMRDDVLNQHMRYIVDFSYDEGESQNTTEAKALLRKKLGLAFAVTFLIITEHKGELLFTPLDDENDANIRLLEAAPIAHSRQARSTQYVSNSGSETNSLPHVAFYLNVKRPNTDYECTFNNSHLWDRGTRVFCDYPNISLIYRVNLERSLQYGTLALQHRTENCRISLDDDTTGAGIISMTLDYRQSGADYVTLDAYFRDWSTDAIAQDYQFVFNSSNNKAQILKTFPRENLNAEYEVKEVSGFQLGVSGGVEVSADGPKGKLEANASYNQSRWLTFKTHDYRVERSTNNAQNVSFKWNRSQYATAESMMNRSYDAIWVNTYPVDTNRINPIGYASFVPKMDVIYKAAPNVTGTTEFTIDSSVNIRPIYNGAYKHYYVVGGHQSYHGLKNTTRRRVSKVTSFTVDWEHPVFTGGRPVNLQLGSFNNRCVDVADNGVLSASSCDENQNSQSFIYDQLGRYVSANDIHQCLDGQSLGQLQPCSSSLVQRWEWIENSDKLSNVFSHELLGHDKTSGELGLYADGNDQVSVRTITAYTNVFHSDSESAVFGFTSGSLALQDVGQSGTLYIRHGAAIDAMGTQANAMQGGESGSLTEIDLKRVTQITVTSGEFKYGGNHLLRMTFKLDDGSTKVVGSKDYAISTHDEVFELPAGSAIRQVKVCVLKFCLSDWLFLFYYYNSLYSIFYDWS